MGIDGKWIEVANVKAATTSVGMGVALLAVTNNLAVNLTVTVNLVDYQTTDAAVAYTSLVTAFSTASTNGATTYYLQQSAIAYGATTLYSASAKLINVVDYTTISPKTHSLHVKNLSAGAIAGIVIGIVLGVALAIGLCIYRPNNRVANDHLVGLK
jgi:hypothetical protein